MLIYLVLAFAFLHYIGDVFGFSISPAFFLVVLSTFCGGFRWGIASAGLAVAAEIILLWPDEPGRLILNVAMLLGIIILVTILRRKAVQLDSLNGNIHDLRKSVADFDDILTEWDLISKATIEKRLKPIYHTLANVTTRVWGWHQLRQEIDEVRTMYDKRQA
jgi:hypothetical protein